MRSLQRCLLCITCSIVLLIGCSPERADTTYILILKSADNPFFVEVERGVRDGIAQFDSGATLVVRAGVDERDVRGQRMALEELAERHLLSNRERRIVLLLTPSGSSDELTPQLRRFTQDSVPIVLLDTQIDSTSLARAEVRISAFVGSDNLDGGRVAGRTLFRLVPRAQRVLLLNGAAGHETADARRNGFLAVVDSLRKDGARIEVTERSASWRRTEARSIVDALLSSGNRFDALFAANDEMALGAAEAYRQNRLSNLLSTIVGFDAIPEARAAVAEGSLGATIAQDPYMMGREGVRLTRDSTSVRQSRSVMVPTVSVEKP